jgi:hypothetical protein
MAALPWKDTATAIDMLAQLLIIAALAISPANDVLRESVDLIELNHFYDEHGKLIFDQVIFYDWSASDDRYQVRAWRLVKSPDILPSRDFARGGYACVWIDGSAVRSVLAGEYRETWTQWDVEVAEREILPKEKRKELRTIRVDKPSGPLWKNTGPEGSR